MTDEPEARDLEAMTRGRDQALDLANRRHGEAIRAAERERAAIVAWLRSKQRMDLVEMPETATEGFWSTNFWGDPEWVAPRSAIKRLQTAKDYADAIERGDHMKEPPHDPARAG